MTGFVLELRQKIFHPIPFVSWIMASLVASYCGPFGTYREAFFPDRIVYWTTIIAVSILIAFSVRISVGRFFSKWSLLEQELAAALVFSMIFASVLWLLNARLFGRGQEQFTTLATMFGFILLIAVSISFLILVFSKARQTTGKSSPALMARLPEAGCSQILSLWAKDHYVHVVTDKGRYPILMRFADAIAELDGIDGAQVHRSYWVARTAVMGAVRRNGRHFVTLVDGSEVPVSRGYRQNAESAGLL